MTLMTTTERKRWAYLVQDILIEARRGSTRARAWFSDGDTWLSIRNEVFKPEVVAEIEHQALEVFSEHKVRFEPAYSYKPNRSPESEERRRKRQNEQYAAKKAAKLALAEQARNFPWPSRQEVTHNGNQTATN
jgi:hypothetical protein